MRAPDARGAVPLSALVAVAVLLAVAGGGVLLTRLGSGGVGTDERAEPAVSTPARPGVVGGAGSESQRTLAGTRALIDLQRAVHTQREALFDRVFSTGRAGSEGADIFTSLRRLPLSTYSMRYISEVAHQGPTWKADVAVQWGLRRVDPRAITSQVEVTFRRDDGSAQVVSMQPARDDEAPVWLLGRLQVVHVGPALVLSLQPPLTAGVVDQTRKAVRDVHHVLHGWDGSLVVVLPRTTGQLDEMLSSKPGTYDNIAAVTASADGSNDPTAPVRVLLNPEVFTGLGPIAAQVVLSHEATHAATGATIRDMPLWLVEGFADYVALAREPVPVDVAAGQILGIVRRSGAPNRLPGKADFATSAHGLGASYEAAWLACRLLGHEYGQDRLLTFYRQVSRTGNADAAFDSVLGTTQKQFTAQWRHYLTELAG